MPNPKILRHRDRLIDRLLANNTMIHFRPSEKGGQRIDFYDLPNVPTNSNVSTNISEPTPLLTTPNVSDNISEIFRTLMKNKNVEISLPNNSIPKRLGILKRETDDRRRTTGLPSCFLAWPFVNIPVENKPSKVAPLLFWQINIGIQGQTLTIHRNESATLNFILEKWLKRKKDISLLLSSMSDDNGEIEVDDLYGFSQKINGMFNKNGQLNVRNDISEENPYTLHKYSSSNEWTIMPCAALGIVTFKYRTLLRDLEDLSNIVDESDDSLLSKFFVNPAASVTNPPECKEPKHESNKYLIEKTDSSQESAIWQARESKIMLLNGPPGTGKSQTIVNLIADALARKESVALVCHQSAALNVVKKRLDHNNIGIFCKKITDPREQRKEIIKGIRNIAIGQDNFPNIQGINQIGELENEIESIEVSLKEIIDSCVTDKESMHSMRGDFLGIIEKTSTNFHFNAFHRNHRQFINAIRNIPFIDTIRNMDVDLQKHMNELHQYALDYIRCEYDKNPWKNAKQDGKSIQLEIKNLINNAIHLDDNNDHLPRKELLPILFNNITSRHAHIFFDNESKETIQEFAKLIKYTREVFCNAKIPMPQPIWEKIYDKTGGDEYKFYAKQSLHLSTILSLNERKANNNLITAFMQYRHILGTPMEDMKHWQHILKSVYCYLKLPEMPRLTDLDHPENHLNKCNQLQKLLEDKRKLNSRVISSKFRSRQQAAKYLSMIGLLKLNNSGNIKATTIRKICNHKKGKDKFREIFPALLMNPDSMCQILPLEPNSIDLVIIDEASQMFVADALPILYRAKKIIISGDNKQMPPDDRFALQNDDDDDDERFEDLQKEPIPEIPIDHIELLDAAEAALSYGHAHCELNVHYRSRPAELIAFSNHAFYDGKLQTAPDNKILLPSLERPIKVISVAGTFNDGINEEEITQIISSLREIWLKNHEPPSVGVIVFNTKQAKRLQFRLDTESRQCPAFKDAYQNALKMEDDGEDDREDVSFFVRSVEHVQGDERDIIILGTTYNTTGSFGDLSKKDTGRKRLNVAVTRAKYGMYVITSLDIDMISNAGERPIGNSGREKWFLWKFMEYARAISNDNPEKAAETLRSLNPTYDPPRPVGQTPESQFELDVGDFIRSKEYTVDYQIGEGGFRIDLGVKLLQDDKRYLCGIECDGRYWHSGWRARHHDVWRQEILKGKGWTIHRIWSDHWYGINADDTKNELLEKLREFSEALP